LIGKVIARLDELQLREQTLVVLLGDNGTGAGTPSRFKGREVAGGKGSSLVWGTHVPGIVQWPGQLAAGKVCGDMLEAADILPTLCEAARVPVPAEVRLDGRSFLPQLRGEKGNPKDALYVWYNPEGGAKAKHEFAHNAHYKLYADGRFFDTRADDLEKNPLKEVDLSPEAAAARSRLQTLLDAHRGLRADYFAKQSRAFGGDAGESAGNLKKEKGDSQNAVPPDGAGGDPKMARFRKRDANHDGKITFAEFQDTISDKKAARARFDARDKDRDGILTVEEFLDASAPAK
jgi:arylsulfatase A